MKHITRRICSLNLAVMLLVSLGIGAAAQTVDDGCEFDSLGEKTAKQRSIPAAMRSLSAYPARWRAKSTAK